MVVFGVQKTVYNNICVKENKVHTKLQQKQWLGHELSHQNKNLSS